MTADDRHIWEPIQVIDSISLEAYDIAIIGGGINGCGIARDAAGRGLKVFLCEQADLGGGTSSASSKLIHGGLRYLEQYEFKLVREALRERETLLKSAPHLIKPMRFILPHHPRLRPLWMIRAGLFLYDLIGGRRSLSRSKWIKLAQHHRASALKTEFTSGFEYADCWADDSRLVISVAKDARRRGATIATRTRCHAVTRSTDLWELELRHEDGTPPSVVRAKTLVNATGPWVGRFLAANADALRLAPDKSGTKTEIKLVQGSHIVVKKWFDGEHAYILQNHDRRIVFVLPFEQDLAIIGCTEIEYRGDPAEVRITPAEIEYLCDLVNQYFSVALSPEDVVWSYSGVRPLYDDGAASLREVTRDYVITLDAAAGLAPIITLYGGKLTTFRRLAEAALAQLAPYFPAIKPPWSADSALPGGKISRPETKQTLDTLTGSYPFLPGALLTRYLSAFGSDVFDMLSGVTTIEDMGRHFGHGLYQIEVAYLVEHEWASSAEDILWRRSKLGLRFTLEQAAALDHWLASNYAAGARQTRKPAAAERHDHGR